jgi:hypothetical protein
MSAFLCGATAMFFAECASDIAQALGHNRWVQLSAWTAVWLAGYWGYAAWFQ